MSVITYVGAGQMASALTFPALDNGHEVRLVGTPLDREIIERARKTGYHETLKRQLRPGIHFYQIEEIKEALGGADAVVCGVSSFGIDWFAGEILPILPDDVPLLSVTKGLLDLEDGSMMTYPEFFEQKLTGSKRMSLNAIGGPCTSYELADMDNSSVAFCGRDAGSLTFLKKLFSTNYYHISLSRDVRGVECAVALKNAYALGVALAIGVVESKEGIGVQHYNSQAALFTQSVNEMTRLLSVFGGGPENIIYAAGDLYVTIFGGRSRKIGILLGRGLTFQKATEELQGATLESVVIATRTARAVRRLSARGILHEEEFPLLLHVDNIINHGAKVSIPWKLFETSRL